jgi:hypothetical protein
MTASKSVREKIINDFSEWTAFSATRSGCPVKSRDAVYPLIRTPKYSSILDGNEILPAEFDDWHQESTLAICAAEPLFTVGWAAKLINIYLKTKVYLAGAGRPGLARSAFIHQSTTACGKASIQNMDTDVILSPRHTLSVESKT